MRLVLWAGIFFAFGASAEQNALVQKYCAVCHTDSARNGGLTLEHFDIANVEPSLAAMMLSKLTGGVPLATLRDPDATALITGRVKSGAINAAGIAPPDRNSLDGLLRELTEKTAGWSDWSFQRSGHLSSASILREAAVRNNNEVESYRLVASCDAATKQGFLQLTWSPVARLGQVVISADGRPGRPYKIEGSEKMGNGKSANTQGLAALTFGASGDPLPAESLHVAELFPGEAVTFPFRTLPESSRASLEACFRRN